MLRTEINIPIQSRVLRGDLAECATPDRLVIFSHGSGSSRKSPRNSLVAEALWKKGISTLLFDLLTEQESSDYSLRFDIPLLTDRLTQATFWIKQQPSFKEGMIGYFGASTGAAAALAAAAQIKDVVVVVSRGGRPDLAMEYLPQVQIPVLLIVGGKDEAVGALNRDAFDILKGEKKLLIIPGATHLFEEPGALERVAESAAEWFDHYFNRAQCKRDLYAPSI